MLTECKFFFLLFIFRFFLNALPLTCSPLVWKWSQMRCSVSTYHSTNYVYQLSTCHMQCEQRAFPKSKSGMQTPYTIFSRARNRSSWANNNTQWILVQTWKSVLIWLSIWTCYTLFRRTFNHLSSVVCTFKQ